MAFSENPINQRFIGSVDRQEKATKRDKNINRSHEGERAESLNVGYICVKGPAVITAKHLKLPKGLKCVDPNKYILTLSDDGIFYIRFAIQISNFDLSALGLVSGISHAGEGLRKRRPVAFSEVLKTAENVSPTGVTLIDKKKNENLVDRRFFRKPVDYKFEPEEIFLPNLRYTGYQSLIGDPGVSTIHRVPISYSGVSCSTLAAQIYNPSITNRRLGQSQETEIPYKKPAIHFMNRGFKNVWQQELKFVGARTNQQSIYQDFSNFGKRDRSSQMNTLARELVDKASLDKRFL